MHKTVKERKTFCLKLNTLNDAGEFSGYASTFGNLDLGNDIVDAGAFKKTLKESKGKIPILDHHDPEKQIGWNISAVEDAKGLRVNGKLDLNVQLARERYSLMKMAQDVGAETGLSIGYETIKSEQDKNDPSIRRLKEIRLLEYSVVVFPMNPSASVGTVKQEPIHSDEPDHSQVGAIREPPDWEPVIHSIKNLISRIQTINQEYSQWK